MMMRIFLAFFLMFFFFEISAKESSSEGSLIFEKDVSLVEIKQLVNGELIALDNTFQRKLLNLPFGAYQYQVKVPGTSSIFTNTLHLSKENPRYVIHYDSSIFGDVIYSWASVYEKGSEGYIMELFTRRCGTGNNTKNYDKNQFLMDCKSAIEKGSVDSMLYLGAAYSMGKLIEKNADQAAKYYEMAFAKGDHLSGGLLARLYRESGQNEKHQHVLNKMIESESESYFGVIANAYYSGVGLPKDINKAKKYALLSVSNGQLFSMLLLSRVYGMEVDKNYDIVNAIAWGELYVDYGKDYDKYFLKYLDELRKKTSPPQLKLVVQKKREIEQGYLNSLPRGRLCISNLSGDASLKEKHLTYSINTNSERIPLNENGPTPIDDFVDLDGSYEITLYSGKDYLYNKKITFDKSFLRNQCIYYDPDLDLFDLALTDEMEGCHCYP